MVKKVIVTMRSTIIPREYGHNCNFKIGFLFIVLVFINQNTLGGITQGASAGKTEAANIIQLLCSHNFIFRESINHIFDEFKKNGNHIEAVLQYNIVGEIVPKMLMDEDMRHIDILAMTNYPTTQEIVQLNKHIQNNNGNYAVINIGQFRIVVMSTLGKKAILKKPNDFLIMADTKKAFVNEDKKSVATRGPSSSTPQINSTH